MEDEILKGEYKNYSFPNVGLSGSDPERYIRLALKALCLVLIDINSTLIKQYLLQSAPKDTKK